MPLGPTEIYIGIFLFIVYLALLFSAGLMTFRRGRTALGIAGFIFPPLWIAGALMKPKKKESPATTTTAAYSKNSQPKKHNPQSTATASRAKKKRRRK